MADTDLIACLYPFEDNLGNANKAIKEFNQQRYIPARVSGPNVQYGRRHRAPTEEPEHHGADPLDYLPRLELRFSQPPKTSHGFVFGWDENSDIVVPWIQGISFHHFALTFDARNRLIVKDLGSFAGTEVTYDKQGEGKRSDFVWIIGGDETPEEMDCVVINVHATLKFQIVVSRHDINSEQYVDNINRFRQGAASMDNLLGQLDIRSHPQTERASGAETPGTGPIVLKKVLGEGTFGVVSHIWDVSTGAEHALKEPSMKAIRAGKVKKDTWEKEAHILRQITHDHIVAFLDSESTLTPWPQLCFEYVPGGALDNYGDISAFEGIQILWQCLSALTYLHGLKPPIIHRDIKPANILVQSRYASFINVKFGDFGLSRATHDPTTICGTAKYLAPEMWNELDRRDAGGSYTPAVDIWSLGVTVCECVYGLPESRAAGVDWCQEIVKGLARDYHYADQLRQFLCEKMLIITPSLRGSAESCFVQALLLGDAPEDHCRTPTLASIQYNRAGQCHAVDGYGEDQQTILPQDGAVWPRHDSQDRDSIDPAEIRRHQRSVAPPPSSQMFGNAASQSANYSSWVTWTGCATPLPEDQIVHNNRGAGRAAQARPEHPSGTVVPPSSCDLDALLDLRAEAAIPPKRTQKRSSKSSSGRKSRKRQDNHVCSILPVEPELDGLWREQLDIPGSLDEGYDGQGFDGQGFDGQGYDGQGYDGQGFEASAEAFSDPRRATWEQEQTEEPGFTGSEAEVAAALLNAIRGDSELGYRV